MPITFVSRVEVCDEITRQGNLLAHWLLLHTPPPPNAPSEWRERTHPHFALCFRVPPAVLTQNLYPVSATVMLSSQNEWAACFQWHNLCGQPEWISPLFFARRGKGCSLPAYPSFSSTADKRIMKLFMCRSLQKAKSPPDIANLSSSSRCPLNGGTFIQFHTVLMLDWIKPFQKKSNWCLGAQGMRLMFR